MSLLLAPYNNGLRLRARASMRGPSAYTEIGKRYPEDEVPITSQRGGDVKDDVDPPKLTETETQPDMEDGKDKKDEEEDLNDSANDGEGDEKRDDDDEDEKSNEADNEVDDKEVGSEGEKEVKDQSQKGEEEKIKSERKVGGGVEGEGSKHALRDSKADKRETGEKERQAGLDRLKKEREEQEKEAALRKEANKKAEVERAPKRALAKYEEEEHSAHARKRAQEKFAEEASSLKAFIHEEMDAFLGKTTPLKSLKDLGDKTTRGVYRYNPTGARGPAQVRALSAGNIVTYLSRFVEKLSDITDDMNISGALSIKYGTIGGSGRGAFINTEKFQESDLNFYISVKVMDQTSNLKDALIYQPLRSMSGSNSAKSTANLLSLKNINNNTETTVQVSWSGGVYIRP
ncbi:hypothetical protein FDECE_12146, partial [Fusarium decemcellulare]